MAAAVYFLCAFTSLACATLLMKAYLRHRLPLLFWSGLCFTGLTLNNVLLVVDLALIEFIDFAVYRNLCGAIATCLMVYGLLWKCKVPRTEVTSL